MLYLVNTSKILQQKVSFLMIDYLVPFFGILQFFVSSIVAMRCDDGYVIAISGYSSGIQVVGVILHSKNTDPF